MSLEASLGVARSGTTGLSADGGRSFPRSLPQGCLETEFPGWCRIKAQPFVELVCGGRPGRRTRGVGKGPHPGACVPRNSGVLETGSGHHRRAEGRKPSSGAKTPRETPANIVPSQRGCGWLSSRDVYVKTTTRRNTDGTAVRYLHLAHNEWDPTAGRSVPKILHSFGREDHLDRSAITRLVTSLSKLLDPADALAATAASEHHRRQAPARPARPAPRPGRRTSAVRAGRQPGTGPLQQARRRGLGHPRHPPSSNSTSPTNHSPATSTAASATPTRPATTATATATGRWRGFGPTARARTTGPICPRS